LTVRYVIANSTNGVHPVATNSFAPALMPTDSDTLALIPSTLPPYSEKTRRLIVPEYVLKDGPWSQWDIIRVLSSAIARLFWLRLTRRQWRQTLADQTTLGLDRLGGLWQEFNDLLYQPEWFDGPGQRPSPRKIVLRPDIPFEHVEQLFFEEFGVSVDEVFSEIGRHPFQKDSFFQTFLGTLRISGRRVDVRVQRPDIDIILERDSKMLQMLTRAGLLIGAKSDIFLPRMTWELKNRLGQISDLRFAAAGLERTRKSLRKENGYVPEVLTQYSSARILTAEQLPTPKLADWLNLRRENPELALGWLRQNGIDLQRLGRRIVNGFLRQLFEENLFRTDLNPQNVLLLRDNCFALTPTPEFASLDSNFSSMLEQRFRALANRDYSKAADYLLLSCDKVSSYKLRSAREEITRMYRAFDSRLDLHRTRFSERSFAQLSTEVTSVLRRNDIQRNSQHLIIGQAFLNLEETLQHLQPEFNLRRESKRYFDEADKRRLARVRSDGINKTISKGLNAVSEQYSFLSSQLRRRSQAFNSLNKTAHFAAVVLRGLRTFLLWAIVLGVLAHQHVLDIIPGYRRSAFGRWSESLRLWRLDELVITGLFLLFILLVALRWVNQAEAIPNDD
jgi:ubiquinone biosynthesis protein